MEFTYDNNGEKIFAVECDEQHKGIDYKCPGHKSFNCSAIVRIKCLESERKTHFFQLRSTPHSEECEYKYSNPSNRKLTTDNFDIDLLLEKILAIKLISNNGYSTLPVTHEAEKYISSVKDFFQFYINNPLDTIIGGKQINSIVISQQTFAFHFYIFPYFSATHLIVAKPLLIYEDTRLLLTSIKYNDELHYIDFAIHPSIYKEIENMFTIDNNRIMNEHVVILSEYRNSYKKTYGKHKDKYVSIFSVQSIKQIHIPKEI